jgi:hypothetical protein
VGLGGPVVAQVAPSTTFITSTIAEIGRPYTVIDAACVYQAFPKSAVSGDPLEEALATAFRRIKEMGAKAGANGLIGFDVDFPGPSPQAPTGRLLLCGTLVKLK